MKAQIDIITANGQGHGDFARDLLLNGSGVLDAGLYKPWISEKDGRSYITTYETGDPMKKTSYVSLPINTNALLRKDEWIEMDAVVMRAAESRLVGVADLRSKGLTVNIGNGMGTTVFQYQDMVGDLEASLSMEGLVRGQNNRPKYSTHSIPLPICHVDYELNERVLNVSRRLGQPIDTSLAERAARAVALKLEQMLFTDTQYDYADGIIYSYVNHPDRNTIVMTTAWDNSAMTGALILADVLEMKQASLDDNHFGPWVIYIPKNYETLMDEDYSSTKGTNTIRDRIMAVNGIDEIKVIDTLEDDQVLMVEMTSDVVRWLNGMAIQNVMWDKEGGLSHNYKVMTIQVPQVRSDAEGQSGLIHMAPA